MLEKIGEVIRKVLPLGNAGKAMVVLAVFVGLFLLFAAMHAHAEDSPSYTQVSLGRAVVRGQAPAMNLAFVFPAPQAKGDQWVASVTLIGASEFRGIKAPNNFAFDVNYVTGYRRFDIGLGPSWMINPYPYNGSRVNFSLQAGYRFERWPVTLWWKHFSCGGACDPNFGRDAIFLGGRF